MEALMDITYGMYVVTTKYKGRNVGCFVNTVSQVTAIEPIISVSINKENYTSEALKKVKRFAISILSENTNPDVIGRFGFFSSRDIDKFKETKYEEINGFPIVEDNICGYAICEVIDVVDAETHEVFLARVLETKKINSFVPMSYKYYHDVIKGKAPKTAPTYMEEKQEESVKEGDKYICIVCGHMYDESKGKVKFEDLPADWICPICGVGKDKFKKVE